MVPTDENWQPPTEQGIIELEPELQGIDCMIGLADGTLATLSGIVASVIGVPAGTVKGFIKSMIDGTYGSQEGASNAQKEMQSVVQNINPYFAQTPQGAENAKAVGKLFESGIPVAPMLGELGAFQAGLKTAMPAIEHTATRAVQPIARAAGKVTPLLEEPTPFPRQSLKAINEESIVKQENAVTVVDEGRLLTKETSNPEKTGTVWDAIRRVEEYGNYPETELPIAYMTAIESTDLFVTPNATKHLFAEELYKKIPSKNVDIDGKVEGWQKGIEGEHVRLLPDPLRAQVALQELHAAIAEIVKNNNKIAYGKMYFTRNNWEIAFGKPRKQGELPAIKHAQKRNKKQTKE